MSPLEKSAADYSFSFIFILCQTKDSVDANLRMEKPLDTASQQNRDLTDFQNYDTWTLQCHITHEGENQDQFNQHCMHYFLSNGCLNDTDLFN